MQHVRLRVSSPMFFFLLPTMYSFISQISPKDATFDSEFIRLCALYVVWLREAQQ